MDNINKNIPISEDTKLEVGGIKYEQIKWIRPSVYHDEPCQFESDVTVNSSDINVNGGNIYKDGVIYSGGGSSGVPDPLNIGQIAVNQNLTVGNDLLVGSINGAIYPPIVTPIPDPFIGDNIVANSSMTTQNINLSSINSLPYPSPNPSDINCNTLTASTNITAPNVSLVTLNSAPYPPVDTPLPDPLIATNITASSTFTSPSVTLTSINSLPYPQTMVTPSDITCTTLTASSNVSVPSLTSVTSINGSPFPQVYVQPDPIVCDNLTVNVLANINDLDVNTNMDVGGDITTNTYNCTNVHTTKTLSASVHSDVNTLNVTNLTRVGGKLEVTNSDIDIITTGSNTFKINGLPFQPPSSPKPFGCIMSNGYVNLPLIANTPYTLVGYNASNNRDFSPSGNGITYSLTTPYIFVVTLVLNGRCNATIDPNFKVHLYRDGLPWKQFIDTIQTYYDMFTCSIVLSATDVISHVFSYRIESSVDMTLDHSYSLMTFEAK